MCVCVCVCVTEAERKTDRETDRRERDREAQTGGETGERQTGGRESKRDTHTEVGRQRDRDVKRDRRERKIEKEGKRLSERHTDRDKATHLRELFWRHRRDAIAPDICDTEKTSATGHTPARACVNVNKIPLSFSLSCDRSFPCSICTRTHTRFQCVVLNRRLKSRSFSGNMIRTQRPRPDQTRPSQRTRPNSLPATTTRFTGRVRFTCARCVAEGARMADFAHFAPSQSQGRSGATSPAAVHTSR